MTIAEAIEHRHSIRKYLDRPISGAVLQNLKDFISCTAEESGLSIDLAIDEPKAFRSVLSHYGRFSGVRNYISISGPRGMDEKVGYCGEKIVLFAETLGLGTCWVALTYSKHSAAASRRPGEKLYLVIAIGYGAEQGHPHKSKDISSVMKADAPVPAWFMSGVNAALLAPTAVNQQKFLFTLLGGNVVKAEAKAGFWSKVDLGIAKYHFEIGAGSENFTWK